MGTTFPRSSWLSPTRTSVTSARGSYSSTAVFTSLSSSAWTTVAGRSRNSMGRPNPRYMGQEPILVRRIKPTFCKTDFTGSVSPSTMGRGPSPLTRYFFISSPLDVFLQAH